MAPKRTKTTARREYGQGSQPLRTTLDEYDPKPLVARAEYKKQAKQRSNKDTVFENYEGMRNETEVMRYNCHFSVRPILLEKVFQLDKFQGAAAVIRDQIYMRGWARFLMTPMTEDVNLHWVRQFASNLITVGRDENGELMEAYVRGFKISVSAPIVSRHTNIRTLPEDTSAWPCKGNRYGKVLLDQLAEFWLGPGGIWPTGDKQRILVRGLHSMKQMLHWVLVDYFFPTHSRRYVSKDMAIFGHHFINGDPICLNRHICWTWEVDASKIGMKFGLRFPTLIHRLVEFEKLKKWPMDLTENERGRAVASLPPNQEGDQDDSDENEEDEVEAALDHESARARARGKQPQSSQTPSTQDYSINDLMGAMSQMTSNFTAFQGTLGMIHENQMQMQGQLERIDQRVGRIENAQNWHHTDFLEYAHRYNPEWYPPSGRYEDYNQYGRYYTQAPPGYEEGEDDDEEEGDDDDMDDE